MMAKLGGERKRENHKPGVKNDEVVEVQPKTSKVREKEQVFAYIHIHGYMHLVTVKKL